MSRQQVFWWSIVLHKTICVCDSVSTSWIIYWMNVLVAMIGKQGGGFVTSGALYFPNLCCFLHLKCRACRPMKLGELRTTSREMMMHCIDVFFLLFISKSSSCITNWMNGRISFSSWLSCEAFACTIYLLSCIINSTCMFLFPPADYWACIHVYVSTLFVHVCRWCEQH